MISTHFPSFSFSPCSGSMSVFWVIAMMGISFLKWCLASCVRETWTFWPQLVHFVLTDITLPCKSRHHAFRWLTHAVVFSRCIMDTQAWFFHQPFGACFFFLANWLKQPEPMGSNCAFVRASESPEIDDLFVVVSKKMPTFKSRNPWLFRYFLPCSVGIFFLGMFQGCSWQDELGSSGAVEHTSAICFWCKCGLEA